jgi:hypothetical protein
MSSRGSSVIVLILIGAVTTLASAAAQDPPAPRETVSVSEPARDGTGAVTMQVSPSEVTWLPVEGHEGTALTVSGPGGVWVRQEFGPGEPPSFSALDQHGSRYPDGSYTYELRVVPHVRRGFDEDLAIARQAGDTERIAELQREVTPDRLLMSGSFAIHQGSFVAPATNPESEPTPPAAGGLRPITAAQHVINDDLVVDGTACIGYACVADSDDTNFNSVTLKGDLLNLIFEDTVGGVTSSRDWLIRTGTIGGDNFDIVDLGSGNTPFFIQGGAPANALSVLSNGNVWISSGNVGVGTVAPGAKLHLFGLQNTDVFASAGTDPTSGPAFNFGYGGASFGRGAGFLNARPDASATAPNPSLRFLTANVERMIITNTGNVGIGTSFPDAKLDIASGEVRLPRGSAGAGFTHFNFIGDGKNYIRGTTIIADNGGSVGIGTTSPASKLHVNGGDIRVSGGSFIDDGVTLNAPDYVFEPDYELMPLDELAAFVRQERHLPNVPKAAEIKQSGLNLSQFQMRLLEKIEELTLYTLEQQQALSAQTAALDKLEEENAALHERLTALERAASAVPQQN